MNSCHWIGKEKSSSLLLKGEMPEDWKKYMQGNMKPWRNMVLTLMMNPPHKLTKFLNMTNLNIHSRQKKDWTFTLECHTQTIFLRLTRDPDILRFMGTYKDLRCWVNSLTATFCKCLSNVKPLGALCGGQAILDINLLCVGYVTTLVNKQILWMIFCWHHEML